MNLRNQFLSRVENQEIVQLFEYLPDVYFWVKDREGRFMAHNQAGIRGKIGCTTEKDVIGKTAYDFFPKGIADTFHKIDMQVVKTGKPVIEHMELMVNDDGTVDWHSTTKFPLFNNQGEVIGITGITRNLKKSGSSKQIFDDMAPVIDYMRHHFHEQIEIGKLAGMMKLSLSQFERKFKKYFNITPLKFIISLRIKESCRALAETRDSIEAIAKQTGFYNTGAFTTKFKAMMKMLPTDYRKKYSRGHRKGIS